MKGQVIKINLNNNKMMKILIKIKLFNVIILNKFKTLIYKVFRKIKMKIKIIKYNHYKRVLMRMKKINQLINKILI